MTKYACSFARRKRDITMEKFYLTTAIAYASRKPHIGNTYEIIMADAFARFQKSQGRDVFLCTGTDEHGQKIEDLAKAAGITPKAYILSRNSKADGSVVGMLAGARFGLHSIPGRWVSAVPVQIKGILGSFIKSCMDYNGE